MPRTGGVMLPARSPDGNYVAFLQKQAREVHPFVGALLRVDNPLQ